MASRATLSVNEQYAKYLLLTLVLTHGVLIGRVQAKPSKWDPILSTINHEGDAKPAALSPFTHSLNDDLLKDYDKEVDAVGQEWKKVGETRRGKKTSPEEREALNRFYYEKIFALNEGTLATLAAASAASAGKNHRALANRILKQVHDDPVAKVENVMSYDPSGQIGFCFGRALFLHYQLLKAGVPTSDIARIFIVGELLLEKQLWNFHTAILVRDAEEGFLVIDPLQPKLMGYREWMKTNAAYEIKGRYTRARFYVTDPRKFLPAFGKYDPAQLEHPALKEYFDALLVQLK